MTADVVELVATTLPCPSWCELPAGHPIREDLGQHARWHLARLGAARVEQLDVLDVDEDGVRVVTDGAQVCIRDANGGYADLYRDELAALLPDLQRALSLLD